MKVTLPNGVVVDNIPEGTTQAQLAAKLAANGMDTSWYKPEAPAAPTKPPAPEPETMLDRAALSTDKILKTMGEAIPDWMPVPSRQQIVDAAAGASTVGGLLKDAPRIQNVANKDSGAFLVGQMADPVMAATGGKAFQAIVNAPKIVQRGRLLKNTLGGAGAGAATSVPMAAKDAAEGDFTGAAGDLATGAGTGAAVGTVLAPAGWVADKAMVGARNLAGGVPGIVSDWAHKEFSNVPRLRQAVENLKGFVPGEKPTVGMAAAEAGSSKLGALEKSARARPYAAEEFSRRDQGNKMARERALSDQVETFAPAEANRKAVTAPLYEKVDAEQVPVSDTLQKILEGDMVQAIRSRAARTGGQLETNAQVAGRPTVPGYTPPVAPQSVSTGFESLGVKSPTTPGEPAKISMNEVQLIKSAMDDEINAFNKGLPSPLGLSNVNVKALGEARRQLITEGERLSPAWQEARQQFASSSQPVNQGNVMSYLLDVLRRPAASEGAASFNTAIKDLPKTFERATGMPRFASGEEALASLSPLGQRTVQGVSKSLQREADVAKNWTAPQSSLRHFENPVDVVEGATPGLINQTLSVLRKGAKMVGANLDEKSQALLDNAMLDPAKFISILDTIPASQRLPALTKAYEAATSPAARGILQAQISNLRSE